MEADARHWAPAGSKESPGVAGAFPAGCYSAAAGPWREARSARKWYGKPTRVPGSRKTSFTLGFDYSVADVWISQQRFGKLVLASEAVAKPEAEAE